MSAATVSANRDEKSQGLPRIIFASAAGTMIEWYDFYIFGSLAVVIASKFYQPGTAVGDIIACRVLDAVATSPTPVRWLVVSAEPVTSVDVTSADMLDALDDTLHEAGIELCFAEMKDPVKDKLKRFGLFARLGKEAFFPTLGAAVSRYLKIHQVAWEDWEDRRP